MTYDIVVNGRKALYVVGEYILYYIHCTVSRLKYD